MGVNRVNLVDEDHDEDDVVARAGPFRDTPTEEKALELQSCESEVPSSLSVLAWIPVLRPIAVARRELEACASRVLPIAERAWLERRIRVGVAASWRRDDVGPRSDASFAQLRVIGPTCVAGRRSYEIDTLP